MFGAFQEAKCKVWVVLYFAAIQVLTSTNRGQLFFEKDILQMFSIRSPQFDVEFSLEAMFAFQFFQPNPRSNVQIEMSTKNTHIWCVVCSIAVDENITPVSKI